MTFHLQPCGLFRFAAAAKINNSLGWDRRTSASPQYQQVRMDRHQTNGDVAITGKNVIKRVRAGERHYEGEGFPATDAGIRNAIQNVEDQRKWRRNSPGEGAPAESSAAVHVRRRLCGAAAHRARASFTRGCAAG